MASARRVRVFFVGIIALVVIALIYTSRMRAANASQTVGDFYQRTAESLGRGRDSSSSGNGGQLKAQDGSGKKATSEDDVLAQQMATRLKEAEQKAKDLANAKAPNKPDSPNRVVGVGSSAGGQAKKEQAEEVIAVKEEDSEEDHKVEAIINDMLAKAPMVIFSKSYCPFSKKAKVLLLEKYSIVPAPFIVELDQHSLGRPIQQRLAKMTGRGTVPNVMINGQSIGGSDDIAALDASKELIKEVEKFASNKITMQERLQGL